MKRMLVDLARVSQTDAAASEELGWCRVLHIAAQDQRMQDEMRGDDKPELSRVCLIRAVEGERRMMVGIMSLCGSVE